MNQRSILEDVAAGRLAPREAARLLSSSRGEASRICVRADYQPVDILGDPTVPEVVVVDGTHPVQRRGDELLIAAGGGEGLEPWKLGQSRRLLLRVNPELEMDIHVVAASLSVTNAIGPLRVVARAGMTRLDSISGPLDATAVFGSATISGAPNRGDWTIRLSSASLELTLSRDADAAVSATGRHSHVDVLGSGGTAVLGTGEHGIEIEAEFSDVMVRAT